MKSKFTLDRYILIIDDTIDERKRIRNSIARAFNTEFNKKETLTNEFEQYVSSDGKLNILEVGDSLLQNEYSFRNICTSISTISVKIDLIIIDIHLKIVDETIFNSEDYNKNLDIDSLLDKFKVSNKYENNTDIPLSLKLLYWIKNSPSTIRNTSQVLVTSTYFNEYKKNLFLYFRADGLMERDYFNRENEKMLYDYLRLFLLKHDDYYYKLIKKDDKDYSEIKEKIKLYNEKYPEEQIICSDPKSLEIFKMAFQFAEPQINVLLQGRSGVGKEVIAKFIHKSSSRNNQNIISINCSTISKELAESQLFGHVKGAFTGATNDHDGYFVLADKGTIFLDEVNELSLDVQAKLLRILQERKFYKLGANIETSVNVRIIAGTNKDLKEETDKTRFREDLFYRLNVAPIYVPPLKERKTDIIPLITFFVKKYSQQFNCKIPVFDRASLFALQLYEWPGNLRELENEIQRILALNKNVNEITYDKLSQNLLLTTSEIVKQIFDSKPFPTLKEIEIIAIKHVVENICYGNQTTAAKILDISRGKLIKKLKESSE